MQAIGVGFAVFAATSPAVAISVSWWAAWGMWTGTKAAFRLGRWAAGAVTGKRNETNGADCAQSPGNIDMQQQPG